MTQDDIKKHYPIGQRCMYYNKMAVVSGYRYISDDHIDMLECFVEQPGRGRTLRFLQPNLRVLRPF